MLSLPPNPLDLIPRRRDTHEEPAGDVSPLGQLASMNQQLTAMATTLQRFESTLRNGLITREDIVMIPHSTPSVAVGIETSFDLKALDLTGRALDFVHLTITEINIAAPQLVNADDVRLRIFRQGARRVPQDLVAEFTGTSAVSGTWQASFANRRIEYTDLNHKSTLWIAVRNSSGNSSISTFDLLFYARVFLPKSRE